MTIEMISILAAVGCAAVVFQLLQGPKVEPMQ